MAEGGLRAFGDRLPVRTDWPTVETGVKYELLRQLPEADVVFLGSSITEAAVDPSEFAHASGVGSAFNSGIPFSTLFSNEWWLNEVVLENVEPQLVVIGLTAWSGGRGRNVTCCFRACDWPSILEMMRRWRCSGRPASCPNGTGERRMRQPGPF